MHVKALRVTLTRQIQPTHCIATVTALRNVRRRWAELVSARTNSR